MDIALGTTVAQQEDDGTVIHVRDAKGEKQFINDDPTKPVWIRIVGTYSSRYRRAEEALRDLNLKRTISRTAEEIDADSIDLIARCILAWDGFTSGGQPYPFSTPAAVALLTACPWIKAQCEAAMINHAAFFSAS